MPTAVTSDYIMKENIEYVNFILDRHLTAVSIISCCLHGFRLASRKLLLMPKEWLVIQTKLSFI